MIPRQCSTRGRAFVFNIAVDLAGILSAKTVKMQTLHKSLTVLIAMTLVRSAYASRQWLVDVGGSQLTFSPKSLTIEVGDSVIFRNLGGTHNVVADNGSFRCAHGCDGEPGGNGAPSSSIWGATVQFPKQGTLGYFCELHGAPGTGMFGTIQVAAKLQDTEITNVPALDAVGISLLVSAIACAAICRNRLKRLRNFK